MALFCHRHAGVSQRCGFCDCDLEAFFFGLWNCFNHVSASCWIGGPFNSWVGLLEGRTLVEFLKVPDFSFSVRFIVIGDYGIEFRETVVSLFDIV